MDACATADVPKKMFERRSEVNLKVLKVTRAIPKALFAAHKRVTQNEQQEIISRMADWSNTTSGRNILNGLQFESIIPANDRTYDVVRTIWNSIKDQQTFLIDEQ